MKIDIQNANKHFWFLVTLSRVQAQLAHIFAM